MEKMKKTKKHRKKQKKTVFEDSWQLLYMLLFAVAAAMCALQFAIYCHDQAARLVKLFAAPLSAPQLSANDRHPCFLTFPLQTFRCGHHPSQVHFCDDYGNGTRQR